MMVASNLPPHDNGRSPLTVGELVYNVSPGVRDCVHVPVIVAQSKYFVRPGDNVAFNSEAPNHPEQFHVRPCDSCVSHGVVDPLLWPEFVSPGERFLVFLKPTFVSGVRHTFDLGIPNLLPVPVQLNAPIPAPPVAAPSATPIVVAAAETDDPEQADDAEESEAREFDPDRDAFPNGTWERFVVRRRPVNSDYCASKC